MTNTKLRNMALISIIAGLLSACGADVSKEIAGVKWNKSEYRLMRFHNNEIQECKKSKGKWYAVGQYELDGDTLVVKKGSQVTRGSIAVTGEGDKKTLVLIHNDDERHYLIDNSSLCSDIQDESVQDKSASDQFTQSKASTTQIRDVKWARTPLNSNQFIRFKNGEMQKCYAKDGIWKTVGPYKLDGNTLVGVEKGKQYRMLVSVTKKDNGQMLSHPLIFLNP